VNSYSHLPATHFVQFCESRQNEQGSTQTVHTLFELG